jgi:hypothetical protein
MLDLANPVIKLCLAGTQAQFEGRAEAAGALFWQAWQVVTDDYEACVAAHYVAGCQATPEATLQWHQEALDRADQADPKQVKSFYPSLYVNLGRAHEVLGHEAEARHYYALAAQLGLAHEPDPEIAKALSMARPNRCERELTD